jgi:hypothetical protein
MRTTRGLLLLFLVAPGFGAALPRYRLAPGDWLTYERETTVSALDGSGGARCFLDQIELGCLAREGNQAYVLLAVAPRADVPTRSDAAPAGLMLYLDERGQRRYPPETLVRLPVIEGALELLPELRISLQAGAAWATAPDPFGRSWLCQPGGVDAGDGGTQVFTFVLDDRSGAADVLKRSCQGRFWFDESAGALGRLEIDELDSAAGTLTRTQVQLKRRQRMDAHWCLRRGEECSRFLRVLRMEERLEGALLTSAGDAERALRGLDRAWSEYLAELAAVRDSPFHPVAAGWRGRVLGRANLLRERAALARQTLGREAAQWSLQDLTGETLTSEGLRERWCVEYFWRSDSVASLRTMQALRELRRAVGPEELSIVCLNMDADVQRGAAAAARCGAELLHVLSGPPMGGEPPRELPFIRVLDRSGRVRAVLLGWQSSLESIPRLIRGDDGAR